MKPISPVEFSRSDAGTGESMPASFHFDQQTRRYSIEGPVGLKNVRLGIEADGMTLWADEAAHATWSDGAANFDFTEPPLSWKVRFRWLAECPALTVSSTLENRGSQPIKLGRCYLANTDDAKAEVLFGARPEDAAALLTKGAGNPPWYSKSLMGSMEPLLSQTLTQWFSPGGGRRCNSAS